MGLGIESGQDLSLVVVLCVPITLILVGCRGRAVPYCLPPDLPLQNAVLVCMSGLSEGQSPLPTLQCAVCHCHGLPVLVMGNCWSQPFVLCGFPPPTREPDPATASWHQSPSNFPTVLVASHWQIPYHSLQAVPKSPAGVLTAVDKSPTRCPSSCWCLLAGFCSRSGQSPSVP